MKDLYIRPDEDNTDILEIEDPVSAFVEQLEVLFFTTPGELLGEPGFGIDLERYVHELILNEYDLKRKIEIQIKKYCPLGERLNWNIEIFFAQTAAGKDVALVNVTIEGNALVGIIV